MDDKLFEDKFKDVFPTDERKRQLSQQGKSIGDDVNAALSVFNTVSKKNVSSKVKPVKRNINKEYADQVFNIVKESINKSPRDKDLVFDYIKWYLLKRMTYMINFTGDVNEFAEKLANELIKIQNGVISYELLDDIISSNKYYFRIHNNKFEVFINNYIMNYCIHNADKMFYKEEFTTVLRYVIKMMLVSGRYNNLVNMKDIIQKSAFKLSDYLLFNNCDIEEIISGRYDMEIDDWIKNDSIYVKSVSERKYSSDEVIDKVNAGKKKIKVTAGNIVKNKIARRTIAFVLAMLVFSNSNVGINFFKKADSVIFQYSVSTDKIIRNFDNYDYPKINGYGDIDFPETIGHIEEIFGSYLSKNKSWNDHYEQICLYEAYSSITKRDIAMMDSILLMTKGYFQVNEMEFEYLALSGYDSYPQYVYDMMSRASLDVSKYTDAVETYKALLTEDGDVKAYDLLASNYKKDIEKMMREYSKYMETLKKEFANDIQKRGRNNGRS